MKMRFFDENENMPVKRSHCGTGNDYLAYQETLFKMQNMKFQPTDFSKKKKKMCSKVVVLRKHLSSRASRRTGDTNPVRVRDDAP